MARVTTTMNLYKSTTESRVRQVCYINDTVARVEKAGEGKGL